MPNKSQVRLFQYYNIFVNRQGNFPKRLLSGYFTTPKSLTNFVTLSTKYMEGKWLTLCLKHGDIKKEENEKKSYIKVVCVIGRIV